MMKNSKNNRIQIYSISFLGILIVFLLCSCDPATGITISNRTNNDIFIEYEFNPELIYNDYARINNNILIKKGESDSIIHLFPATKIIEQFAYIQINNNDDIINAINTIFFEINVYKIINNERIILYNKDYFLQKNNIKKHKYPIGYSLEFIIRE